MLQHKLGYRMLKQIYVTNLGYSAEKVKQGEVNVECVEDFQLHVPDLLASVGIVSGIDKVRNLGNTDFVDL